MSEPIILDIKIRVEYNPETDEVRVRTQNTKRVSKPRGPNRTEFFEAFWKLWKGKGSKAAAKEQWRINKRDEDFELIENDLDVRFDYDPDWIKEEGKFIPHAKRYLKESYWLGEWSKPAYKPKGDRKRRQKAALNRLS